MLDIAYQIQNFISYNYVSHYLHQHHYCISPPSTQDFTPRSLHKLMQCVVLIPKPSLHSEYDVYSLWMLYSSHGPSPIYT